MDDSQISQFLELLISRGPQPVEAWPADVDWVIDLFRRSGAIEHGEGERARRLRQGIDLFQSLSWIPDAARTEFAALAEYLIERKV